MRINTQFPVAVHILVLVAIKGEGVTSEIIAKSVNTNPVVIRRINALLKKANIIAVKAGVGGTMLNHAPKDITLLDIYKAVKTSQDELVFDLHNNPNIQCPIGSNIHEALSAPFISAQRALEDCLGTYTLADMVDNILAKHSNS
jgi:DNA-binding IscR family transcriptional regulator